VPDIDAMITGGEYQPLPDIAATQFMGDESARVGGLPALLPGVRPRQEADCGIAGLADCRRAGSKCTHGGSIMSL
jgi:hypothetical protein